MTSRKARIEALLEAAFSPSLLSVNDDSGRHAGHQPGMDGAGETHFTVTIAAPAFSGMNRVDRHRAVNAALKGEFDTGLHALSVDAREA